MVREIWHKGSNPFLSANSFSNVAARPVSATALPAAPSAPSAPPSGQANPSTGRPPALRRPIPLISREESAGPQGAVGKTP